MSRVWALTYRIFICTALMLIAMRRLSESELICSILNREQLCLSQVENKMCKSKQATAVILMCQMHI